MTVLNAHNNIRDARKKATYFVWPVYQNENQEVSPGDHVVAVYVDNQRPYIVKAIDIDGSDVHITFMAPYLDEIHQYFRWPKSEIWVDSHEILCVVPEPNSNKRGALHFLRCQEKVHWNYILRGNDFNI